MQTAGFELRQRSNTLIARSRAVRQRADDMLAASRSCRQARSGDRPASPVGAIAAAARQAAARHPNPIARLAQDISATIASEADPYILVGALLEAVSCAISRNVPPERRRDVAAAAVSTLCERMAVHRLL